MLRTAIRLLTSMLVIGAAVLAITAWAGYASGFIVLAVVSGASTVYIARRYLRPAHGLATELPRASASRSTAALIAVAGAELRRALTRAQEAEMESARRAGALAHTADGVLIIESTGLVEYANPTARLFMQNRVLDVAHRLAQPDLERLVDLARSSGVAVAEDVTLWVPGAKPARARAVPLADGATVVLLSDLSETHRIDRVRRDFVANVSHELKTPVAGIRALAETAGTALTSDDLDTATRFVERLGMEAARLAGLVTDLLDLSRVEAAGELAMTTIDLDSMLAEAADRARPIAEVKNIVLVVKTSMLSAHADAAQLTMAVKNLVDNAVRYSEGGTVELAATSFEGWVRISVADQGIGIPSDEIPRIFERFYRVDKARSRATGGTGLGLAIVKHVVENHGGRVEVESELGRGSKFLLILPVMSRSVASEESAV